MYCPYCFFQMTVIQRKTGDGVTFRIYECGRKCEWDGIVETQETVCRSSTTKKDMARRRKSNLEAAMKRVAKDMRDMKHENLSDLERQALRFAAGWIERRNE